MNSDKANFLSGELDRAIHEYPDSDLRRAALRDVHAHQRGDLTKANTAIKDFMDATSERESYDHELA
jgi:hypothetical protein